MLPAGSPRRPAVGFPCNPRDVPDRLAGAGDCAGGGNRPEPNRSDPLPEQQARLLRFNGSALLWGASSPARRFLVAQRHSSRGNPAFLTWGMIREGRMPNRRQFRARLFTADCPWTADPPKRGRRTFRNWRKAPAGWSSAWGGGAAGAPRIGSEAIVGDQDSRAPGASLEGNSGAPQVAMIVGNAPAAACVANQSQKVVRWKKKARGENKSA